MSKKREIISVGDSIPKISNDNHADFILNYQQSILLALVKRNLLTLSQYERCMEEFQRQQNKSYAN